MKKTIAVLTIALSTISLFGCSSSKTNTTDNQTEVATTKKSFDIELYKKSVGILNDSIMETSILVSNMAQYENNYWSNLEKIGGTIDYKELVDKAYNWLEKKSDTKKEDIEKSYSNICNKFKEVSLQEVSGKEAEELQSSSKELFQAFDSLYDLATNPTGDNSSFVSNYNKYIETIKSTNNNISVYLK